MSMAFSNNIDEKSISWNSESLMSNGSVWSVISGAATLGTEITLQSNSEIQLNLDYSTESIKCNYLKLLTHLTCADTTLTTDNVHNVCVLYEVLYSIDDNGTEKEELVTYEYYPKYDFEESFEKDYTIIKGLGVIKSISITILNYESIPVVITNSGLYVNYTVDEDTLDSRIQSSFNKYASNLTAKTSCIDVLSADPDPSTVPNGVNKPYCYMWILSSAIS